MKKAVVTLKDLRTFEFFDIDQLGFWVDYFEKNGIEDFEIKIVDVHFHDISKKVAPNSRKFGMYRQMETSLAA